MSSGHVHLGGPHMTQNQGNVLGDRPCVRQSRLYREQVGGNVMKDLLGQQSLKWDTNRTEGAYKGGRVYDHINQQYETGPRQTKPRYDDGGSSPLQSKPVNRATDVFSTKPSTEAPAAPTGRRGGANASRQTYNVITGQ
jgi:hypothetical protein